MGGLLILSGGAFAMEKELLHKQSPLSSELQVHTTGRDTSVRADGLLDMYAPPKNISTEGAHFDAVFRYVSWGTAFYFALMVLGVFAFAYIYRERPGHKAFYTLGLNEKKFCLIFDIIFFISMDTYLIYHSVNDTKKYLMTVPQGPDVVKIEVMPQQWAWNFRYPGKDGVFNTPDDVVTLNEMWIPKGKQVSLQIKSKDVIHGFMVPNIRRQVDAMPGSVTRLWFDANENGDYEIACMHLCGTSHYKMKGFMKVVDETDYKAWVEELSEWSAARHDPNDKRTLWGWDWGLL